VKTTTTLPTATDHCQRFAANRWQIRAARHSPLPTFALFYLGGLSLFVVPGVRKPKWFSATLTLQLNNVRLEINQQFENAADEVKVKLSTALSRKLQFIYAVWRRVRQVNMFARNEILTRSF